MTAGAAVAGKNASTLVPVPPATEIKLRQLAAARAARSKRPAEHVEDYPHIVAVLDAKTRVIECADGIQWVIQRRTVHVRNPWKGRSFCRTKRALLRIAGEHPALLALPDRFPEEGRAT